MKALEDYLEERNQALSTLDLAWARRQLPQARDDNQRLLAMHKARYDCTSIDAKLRQESGAWLLARGFGGLSGPILPNGELPQ